MSTERPILFSAPMVRAILEGRKRQTRRVVKWPSWVRDPARAAADLSFIGQEGGHPAFGDFVEGRPVRQFNCPFGGRGDRLWGRETFAVLTGAGRRAVFRADGDPEQRCYPGEPIAGMKWTPSIHMPRWASRISLEVTEVRVERLQDISEEDAKAEGSPLISGSYSHRGWFRELWAEINGAESWDANPWVWVVGFRRIEARPEVT